MHSILPPETKVLQTIELPIPIEKAWELITTPRHMVRWIGGSCYRVDLQLKVGTDILFHRQDEQRKIYRAQLTDCLPPYQFAYRYMHNPDELPERYTQINFHLMVLPRNCSMVYVQQTGFYTPFAYTEATLYWRSVLDHLLKLI